MDGLRFILFYMIGYRKSVVQKNVINAFPEMTPEEVKSVVKQFYIRFSEYMAETLKAISISEEEIKKRVKFVNVPSVQHYADKGQSIILAGTHQFNWEWALLTGCLVLPFLVDAVYKRLSDPKMDALMRVTRGKFGGKPIESKSLIRSLVKSKERIKAVAIMGDQSPKMSAPKYWTTFMNQETAFFSGLEQIATALQYPVFFYRMNRLKRGYYTVELVKLKDPPHEKGTFKILDQYVKQTEELIKADPPSYLWSHKRWKLKRDN